MSNRFNSVFAFKRNFHYVEEKFSREYLKKSSLQIQRWCKKTDTLKTLEQKIESEACAEKKVQTDKALWIFNWSPIIAFCKFK